MDNRSDLRDRWWTSTNLRQINSAINTALLRLLQRLVKFQLLPSTFGENGTPSVRQHLTCFVVNDCVAFDAGSLAMSVSDEQRASIRDIVLTHAHLDHIAGLPLFIDDNFATLTEPVRIHAAAEVIEVLERDVFNWSVYPRFSELKNEFGKVLEYIPFVSGKDFEVCNLTISSVEVNHKVPSSGFIISDDSATVAMSGDTAEMDSFWDALAKTPNLSALLIECAFPDELGDLADQSHHLTPRRLAKELEKFNNLRCPIYAINLKPVYRDRTVSQIANLGIERLRILEVGRIYEFLSLPDGIAQKI